MSTPGVSAPRPDAVQDAVSKRTSALVKKDDPVRDVGPKKLGDDDLSCGSPTPWIQRWEWDVLTASTVFKILLWPCYHSTDFEVHRNWLAITRSLPIRQWYFEDTSQWTLDYPPFFAYFSWILAQPAVFVDPLIVSLHEGLEYAAWSGKAYMRTTVIVTELVLAAALLAHSRPGAQRKVKLAYHDDDHGGLSTPQLLAASLLMHPGLIIIDHIHFQYNGFLFGVLAWSLWAAREDRPLLCAFLFSSLLNLKHIYVYIAPPFLVFLLRSYVFPVGSTSADLSRGFERLLTVGAVTLIPFFLSLVPLAIDGLRHEAGPLGVLSQMLSRLFPFSRGLIHAYWAPNAWALWTFADRVLVKVLQRSNTLRVYLPASFLARYDSLAASGFASASRGLVENVSFGVLPDVQPSTCFLLTLTCSTVYMLKLWQAPTYRSFLASISLCGFASFLFGWHVHEKAIMLVLIPYTFLAAEDYAHFRTFIILSTAGIVSLFPLLYEPAESPIKIVFSLLWAMIVFGSLKQRVYRPVEANLGLLVHGLETTYLWGFIVLQAYVSIVHPLMFSSAGSGNSITQPTLGAEIRFNNSASVIADLSSLREVLLSPPSKHSAGFPESDASVSPMDGAFNHSSDDLMTAESNNTDFVTIESSFIVLDSTTTKEFDRSSISASSPISSPSMTAEHPASFAPDAVAEAPTASPSGKKASDIPTLATANVEASQRSPTASQTTTALPASSHTSSSSMEFLPLMMVSVYCSIGVLWCWLRASTLYLTKEY